MTTVYFVRHAEADNSNSDGRNRPLTKKGFVDRKLVTEFLHDKNIGVVISSPYKRAIDTISVFAEKNGFEIEAIEDLREHEVGAWRKSNIGSWITDFKDFIDVCERQWADFSYKYPNGESLAELQERNVNVLSHILSQYKNINIVIGTHGAALSTIINYYDKTFGFENYMEIINTTPWIVRMDFNDSGCIGMEKIDLFNRTSNLDFENCTVRTDKMGALKAYKYTVVFARYKDKWLYCRAKERDTFETAGGRIEEGETPLDAAKRELFEETGAIRYEIVAAFDYSVHYPNVYANGQVFFAQIYELGVIPDYEMAEVKLFDTIPDKMRFPKILPVLFKKMRELLND
jgi:2,3-bisphosphoglycerate-dependent phosphoglycerate mutase